MNLKEVFLNLTPLEFKIWVFLQIYIRENEFINADIASNLQMSQSSIEKSLRTFKLLNLIKVVEKRNEGHQTKNRYCLNGVFYDVFSSSMMQKQKDISRHGSSKNVDPKAIIDDLIKNI